MKSSLYIVPLCLALLAACSTVSPRGLAQLATLSPLTADPEHLAIRFDSPPGLAIQDGSVRMALSAERSDTAEKSAQVYVLQGATTDVENQQIYRIAPEDFPRLRVQQARISAWQEEAGEATTGSLSVTIGGCGTGSGPARDAEASVYIKTQRGGAFIPLVQDAPLRAILGSEGLAGLGPCNAE